MTVYSRKRINIYRRHLAKILALEEKGKFIPFEAREMFVKLENAKIDVDREFLITHFDYVERWYESELTQNREQLNLDGFLVNDFNNLVELIQARWPET